MPTAGPLRFLDEYLSRHPVPDLPASIHAMLAVVLRWPGQAAQRAATRGLRQVDSAASVAGAGSLESIFCGPFYSISQRRTAPAGLDVASRGGVRFTLNGEG